MKNLILSLACATALVGTVAQAQTSTATSTTTTAGGTSQTTTTTTEATGTIGEWTPGTSFTLTEGSGAPTHYRFGKEVTYVTPDGKVIEASKVRKGSHVRVHYMKEGNDMVVSRVTVME
ncbi:MAG: hypothetical protein JO117_10160 [Verrucomicrobia bacterium]|nr:hypothetical protein [Verrucomicrobiota bacterium]MBV9658785.1 hypothetical protein [Verrucomicrobiota bacterium]